MERLQRFYGQPPAIALGRPRHLHFGAHPAQARAPLGIAEEHQAIQSRLGHLASDFQMNIGGVSTPMLRTWLDSMDIGGRTKRNYLMAIGALFRFAAGRKYLPKDAIEKIEAVQQAKEDNGEIEIFTPAELAEILAAARPEMIPWLTIAGFAGLRDWTGAQSS